MEMNRLLMTDSYKHSHYLQYPAGTTNVFSYLECRGSEREYTDSVFFGLQCALKKYFSTPITLEEVEEAKEIVELHGEPFNYEGWLHIVNEHNGKLPLKIRAVKEGTVVPLKNVLLTVENTCDKCFWVTSFFETLLMCSTWYPITVATQSHYLRKLIYGFLEKTADDPDAEIAFKLHDFGSRGVSSQESAGLGGLAHLVSFMGTDTMQALLVGRNYYHADMAGYSIPAGEHSTFSSWGRDGEVEAYRNMLDKFGHTGKLLAVVSDTWDIYNACENIWGGVLKQEVIDSGATVVIRPDSGDPVEVLCGVDPKNTIFTDGKIHRKVPHGYYGDEIGSVVTTQQFKGVLQILAEKFGYTTNSKGYKVLNNVRVIQGDGVNPESIKQILTRMTELGFSTTNIAFGMGGALLQKVNRDTLKMAYKCSAIKIDGKWIDVYKDPVTDKGKTSKKGRLDLIKTSYGYVTQAIEPFTSGYVNTAMVTYFENGEILVDDNFEAIRERLALTKS